MQNLTEVARSKTLLLKVQGHSVTAAMGDGEFIKSRSWIVGGHTWEIHLRPKDHRAGSHRPVTLKVVLLSAVDSGNVKANLSCRLVDPAGKLGPSEEKTVAHKFHRLGDYSGPAVLTARQELEASGYLVDDSYTVQCSIAVLREAPPQTAAAEADDRRLEADVPSPDLLRGTCASSSGFKALLGFLYTDTAPELDGVGDEATSLAQHLLAAADRYGLDRLKLMCEWKLSEGITVGTAATTLALAEQHKCSQLKARCVEFIAGYLDAVLETEGYKHLEASCPSVLTELLKAARGGTS